MPPLRKAPSTSGPTPTAPAPSSTWTTPWSTTTSSTTSAPKAINRQQEQDRAIAQMKTRIPVASRDEPPHIRPLRTQWQVFLAKQARGENDWRQIPPPPSLLIDRKSTR